MNSNRFIWLVPLALGLSAQAAEPAPDDQFALGEVVVTARTRDNEMIGGAEVRAEDLRRYDKSTVDQALDLVPGTTGSATGGSRNERLVYVRGFDRFETTLSIDGVRVFLPADNRIDFARFLTADLASIQISKGYVSVLDGPGGLGGAINLVTRKPTAALEMEASGTATFDGDGNYSGNQVSARVGTRQDGFYLQASGARSVQHEWTLSNDFVPTAIENGGERDHSANGDYRVNLKAGFTPNDSDEYALSYTRQSGDKNAPYHVTDTANTRFWSWPYWDLDSVYFLSSTKLGDRFTLRTRIYRNAFYNALYSYDDASQTTQSLPRAFRSIYIDRAYGARAELDTELGGGNTLRSAVHFRNDKHVEYQQGFVRVPATGSPSANQPYTEPDQTTIERTYSAALEDTQQLGAKVDLIGGVSYDWTDLQRAEDISVFVTGTTLANSVINLQPVAYPLRNSHAVNGQAALSWRATDATRYHVSVSSRTRFPTLFERFSSRFGTAVPNPDIKAERATNYELGVDSAIAPATRVQGAVFYSDVRDALLSVPVVFGAPISATLNQTRNVGKGRYYGAEGSIDTRLTGSLSVGGNYTYLHRELTDPTNAAFHPTGVPTHKLFAHLDWSPVSAFMVSPNVEWASSRWTVTSSTLITPPRYYETGSYVLANLVASVAVNSHFEVLVGARNIFDRNYQLVDGFPEPGRNYYLNFRAR